MAELDEMVARFLSRGATIVPCAPRTKRAYFRVGTQVNAMNEWRDAKARFGDDINAAVLLNASGLCVFDFDDYRAAQLVMNSDALPPYFVTRTRRGLHLYYERMPGLVSGTIIRGEQTAPYRHFVGHYLSGGNPGQYAMLPGSTHTTGSAYTEYCGSVDCIGIHPSLGFLPSGNMQIASDVYVLFDEQDYGYDYDYDD